VRIFQINEETCEEKKNGNTVDLLYFVGFQFLWISWVRKLVPTKI